MLKLHEIGDFMIGIRELDQFFTQKETVSKCLLCLEKYIDKNNIEWIEPSAGSGAFIDGAISMGFVAPKVAYDIMPQHEKIKQADFLKEDVSVFFSDNNKAKLFIGNPPFGKNSSLAIKFFNHMAQANPNFIAMVLPATFAKNSIKNKLNLHFELIEQLDLGSIDFSFGMGKRKVPVVFQIWKKSNFKREKFVGKKESSLFNFVSKDNADFAIQRVGAAAGKIKLDFKAVSPNSHYFIKQKNLEVLDKFKTIDWTEVKNKTAGNPSISKSELIEMLEKCF